MRHLVGTLTIESVGEVTVSTVDLGVNLSFSGYETCLFWRRESEVVETYRTWKEAVERHDYWLQPENAARGIAAHSQRKQVP